MTGRDPMNQEIKQLWVQALRSGEYEQGTRNLRNGNLFCCLGVLCELAVKAGVVEREGPSQIPGRDPVYHYGDPGCSEVLPAEVVAWAGLDHVDPELEMSEEDLEAYPLDEELLSLSSFNDLPQLAKDFDQIADLIEEHL